MLRSSAGSRWLPYAVVASCMLGTGGCDIVREPTALDAEDGPIAVHAMLVAGERRVAVLVTRYDSGGVYGRNYRLVPVARAEVRITGAGQTITLASADTAKPCVDDHGYTPSTLASRSRQAATRLLPEPP